MNVKYPKKINRMKAEKWKNEFKRIQIGKTVKNVNI